MDERALERGYVEVIDQNQTARAVIVFTRVEGRPRPGAGGG